MLDSLRFVNRGNPSHFAIRKGRVTASNGVLSLSAPLPLSFDAAPLAIPFLRALDACEETISITQESAAKLIVRSGTFRADVPCVDIATLPVIGPEGVSMPVGAIVAAFTSLRPFICLDKSKTALCSILLDGQSAYATNNIVLAQYWIGGNSPVSNIPVEVVDEVLKIKEEPVKMQICEGSITFHYEDGRWIRSQLNAAQWPNVGEVLNCAWEGSKLEPVSGELKQACAKLAKYVGKSNGKTYFRGEDVATEEGAARVTVTAPVKGCYWTRFLGDVLEAAIMCDFGKWPGAVPWVGDKVRGILLGVRE